MPRGNPRFKGAPRKESSEYLPRVALVAYVKPEVRDAVVAAAAACDVSMSQFMRDAILARLATVYEQLEAPDT